MSPRTGTCSELFRNQQGRHLLIQNIRHAAHSTATKGKPDGSRVECIPKRG